MTDPVRLQAVSFLCGELEHVVFDGYSWGGITYEIGSVLSLQHWSKVRISFFNYFPLKFYVYLLLIFTEDRYR